jgi:hypothetical protein
MDSVTIEQASKEDELVWLNVQLQSSLKSQARIQAAKENIPMSELVRRAIIEYLGLPTPAPVAEAEPAEVTR